MSTTAKLRIASVCCLVAFVTEVAAGHLLGPSFDRAGVVNFIGLGVVAAAVMALLASLWSAFAERHASQGD